MSDDKKIESGTRVFDCDNSLAIVRSHKDGILSIDFWRERPYCNGDETPAIGVPFDVRSAKKMANLLSKFVDIEAGGSRWSGMVGGRAIFAVVDKDDHALYDYHDAVVLDHVLTDDGSELVLLLFGERDMMWTRVNQECLETSNKRFYVASFRPSGDVYGQR